MAKRVGLHERQLDLIDIDDHHRDLAASLRLYFSANSPSFQTRFAGYKLDEVDAELRERINEIEMTSALIMLTALEATFKIDYLIRVNRKMKDKLSCRFRDIYKIKKDSASLDDDIFDTWRDYSTKIAALIGELRGAFKLRHWLAHGRYWTPKLGRPNYDYDDIFALADEIVKSFPFVGTNDIV
jgi:hypothetical protein